jgi:nitrate/TMAO reductase-like tetraheme cytochrome c subunit
MSVQTKKSEMFAQAEKSEFFCGYCHILTYPRVLKKAYTSWKAGKHKNVGCVECHYPPERTGYSIPQHKGIPRDERYAGKKSEWDFMRRELEVLSRLITIQNMDEPVVRTKPRVDDLSCSSTKCHPTTGKGKEGEYWTKKIEYAKFERADKSKGIVQFVHDKHFDPKKQIEGQELHCTSCHQRESEKFRGYQGKMFSLSF